jgi:hypothetical protein
MRSPAPAVPQEQEQQEFDFVARRPPKRPRLDSALQAVDAATRRHRPSVPHGIKEAVADVLSNAPLPVFRWKCAPSLPSRAVHPDAARPPACATSLMAGRVDDDQASGAGPNFVRTD